jgi:hypothetical protein
MNVDSLLTLEGIAIHITRLNIALENFPADATEEQIKMKAESEEQVEYWLAVLRRSKGLIK